MICVPKGVFMFAKKLISLRAKLNLSQKELSKLLGVSTITISRWENEQCNPNKVAIIKFEDLCKEKGISL